jgi:hypothetical protein
MTAPFVGLPTVADAGCAFSVGVDQPACGRPPTTHLCVDSPGWGIVALSACGFHVGLARATGTVVTEHPHQSGCDTADCWGTP